MQGNKKQTDGQSDSSSIGSLLDDTDREVCSLTDRAFKSLCVAELQTPYADADPAGPSNIPHQFSSKFFHGPWNYAIKKNTDFHKQLSKKEHTTFLLSKVSTNSKTREDKKCFVNNPSIRRKLDLPLSDLCNCTHISKVSSLIKTFDQVDNQVSLLIAKQPVNNSLTECPLICGDNMAFWSDKTFLNIQKGISEFPEPCQNMANPSDKRKGYNKIDLAYQKLPGLYPSQAKVSNTPKFSVSKQMVKNRTGKTKELARKSSFLHSENSAFESWNAHHKKLIEMGEMMPKDGSLTYFEETPFFKKPCISERKASPPKAVGPFILEESFSDDSSPKSLSKASLSSGSLAQVCFPSPPNAKNTVAQRLLPQVSGVPIPVYESPSPTSLTSSTLFPPRMTPSVSTSPVPISKAPIPSSSFPQVSVPPEAAFHSPDTQEILMPQITLLVEKTKPEFALRVENDCPPPPWRKQKTTLSSMKLAEVTAAEGLKIKDSSFRKSSDVTPLVKTSAAESHMVFSDQPNPSFSISTLLTPVIPLKQKDEDPSGNRLLVVTPLLLEAGITKDSEERTLYSQNDYKSKAPRLLFNLKDIRKRVKSTYSPSPLLRAFEDKSKMKEQIIMKANVTAANVPEDSNTNMLGNTDKVNTFEQMDYIQEKDNFTSLNENLIGNDVMMSLSKSRAYILKSQNKNHLRQSNSVHTEDFEMISAHEHNKSQPSPSPNPYPTDVAAAQQEDMQEHKYKKVTLGQDADEASKNLFFPAEENTSNNESQAYSSTGNDHKGKRSTSSSEQSFVSTVDQPFHETPSSLMQLFRKACLQESQRRKNDIDEREKRSSKEKEKAQKKDLRDYLLSNCDFNIDEIDEKNENENVLQEAVSEEKKKDRWKSMDCESESKPEEPLTSNSLKPNLFMIKDNTFKSPPVTKAIKLPLLRSLSCEETTPNAQESPKNAVTERRDDESGSIQGNMGCQMAETSNLTAFYSFREGLDNFHIPEMMADSEETDLLSVLSEKEFKSPSKEVRIGKLRPSSAFQPNLGFESEPRQNEQRPPTRERINYMKSHVLSKQRGGSCIKKIISQEIKSPIATENHPCSPVSSDAFGRTSTLLNNSASSTIRSPRSDRMVPSAFKGPSSDTTSNLNISEIEKAANYPLPKATENIDKPSPTLMFDPEQTCQLSGDADSTLGTKERLQLMSQMGRTAAKPPTVPPKTEKALRRAKKLANKRKKMEAKQKKLQDEPLSQNEDAASLTPVQSLRSLVCPNSPLTSPKCSRIKQPPMPSLSPTPSLSVTQRKLLQDPDSGEYFILDLPIQLKTFYDPESGRYIQVSVPPSKRNRSQTPSSEIALSPYSLCPSALPPRVASVPALPSPSQLSETASRMQALPLGSASDEQPGASCPESLDGPPCTDSAMFDTHSKNVDGSPSNSEKDMSTSATTENISVGSAEAVEAVEGIL
ncbi:cardiac-enriched FHL2-interacting protein [Candoia aspera]|uniref:cardiac-enriched FHL2-interacting protein n=1 Tax=Candoia aspera TaxID=51853 RepID=UPI002FD7DB78